MLENENILSKLGKHLSSHCVKKCVYISTVYHFYDLKVKIKRLKTREDVSHLKTHIWAPA